MILVLEECLILRVKMQHIRCFSNQIRNIFRLSESLQAEIKEWHNRGRKAINQIN